MYISYAEIENYRALEKVSVPLNQFSILIGENDVGKSSFLYALDAFFSNKKIADKNEYFKNNTDKDIIINLTFKEAPDFSELKDISRKNGDLVISRRFGYDKPPATKAIKDDKSEHDIEKKVLQNWFSSENFDFIPVRRDLSVQFSMKKEALLGKTLRVKMKSDIEKDDAKECIGKVETILKESLITPKATLQKYLQEQMHNDKIMLNFKDLEVDPIEGVKFSVMLSDDRVEDILIENRGAGTQNNLIIALFRLVASLHMGGYFIFVLEEPENSLHPKAQRQLLSVLQDISKESQVICTTHSPVFLERSKFENNIILNRTIKGNTIAKTFNISLLNEVRTDLGIRPSDALLKGGGNCAVLVEGNNEEEGFPIFMEMLGFSEFQLGISIINMRGSDTDRVSKTARLLLAYDIPCIVVLDNNAKKTAEDIERESKSSLKNIKKVFCLKKGNIEDYYPLDVVAEVMNKTFGPDKQIKPSEFDSSKHGKDRMDDFVRVMMEHGIGDAKGYLKRCIGLEGTKIIKERGGLVDSELREILLEVKKVAEAT